MDKKDLIINMEFTISHKPDLKGRVVKLEEDTFTILWVDTKQFYDYPYDEGLLKSMVVKGSEDNLVKKIEEKIGKKEKEIEVDSKIK